jgi:hypothetical protein
VYRSCIFCSSGLGVNESIEAFQVGSRLAFDSGKGRLWALCPRCGRWNLAPIEERWEAVEEAEKRFRDSRVRAQSENIGLAKLDDGTRLVRVGAALPGELASWRYGDHFRARRRRALALGAGVAVLATGWAGLALAGVLGGAGGLFGFANLLVQHRMGQRPVHRVSPELSPTGEEILIRRVHLNRARVVRSSTGVALELPEGMPPARVVDERGRAVWLPARELVLEGETARTVMARAAIDANRSGGSPRHVRDAVDLLREAGGAEPFLASVAERGTDLGLPHAVELSAPVRWKQIRGSFRGDRIPASRTPAPMPAWGSGKKAPPREQALALEMALHEETERRALEGELKLLEAAWREAEEIAAIADVLPYDPLERLGLRG